MFFVLSPISQIVTDFWISYKERKCYNIKNLNFSLDIKIKLDKMVIIFR